MKVYWQQENNFGDKLTPYILKKLFNIDSEFSNDSNKLLAVGSILHHAVAGDTIWGSGIISPKHLPKSSILKVLAVRGPLTRDLLQERGVNGLSDVVFGDPALLLPMIYFPKRSHPLTKEGIIPHYTDYQNVKNMFKDREKKGEVKVIDVREPVEKFIDELCSCEMIFSSSLHGAIVADAYNIPNKHIRFGDGLIGGDFKFNDYYESKKYINLKDLIEVFKINIINNGRD